MRRPTILSIIVGALHATFSFLAIPHANAVFQSSFDTGMPMSPADRVVYLAAWVLSTPFAWWTMVLHPERQNDAVFFFSVILTSCLWAGALFVLLRRTRAPLL